jgi:hypothetical protein
MSLQKPASIPLPPAMAWQQRLLQPPEASYTARLYWLEIPKAAPWRLDLAVAPGPLETVLQLMKGVRHGSAVAAINGGYFDPVNGLTTSHLVQDGRVVGDPRLNARLMQNPQLAPWLEMILTRRTELRQYRCGLDIRNDIVPHTQPPRLGCTLLWAMGGGPRLLPQGTAEAEGFVAPGRDPLGVQRPNARSAVGLTRQGDVLLVMVAQEAAAAADPDALPTSAGGPGNAAVATPGAAVKTGVTLSQLASLLEALGAVEAMALDGGSSSSLCGMSGCVSGKRDVKTGRPVMRRIRSALVVIPQTHANTFHNGFP